MPASNTLLFLHTSKEGPPKVRRSYDASFKVSPAYRAELPDMMEALDAIEGAKVPLQQVGIANFKLPLRFPCDRSVRELEVSVTGTVSLEASLKGINMSRILRSFYEKETELFSLALLEKILLAYRRDLGSPRAKLRLSFSYPMRQKALRSGLSGWQYYPVTFEGQLDGEGQFRGFIEFDFTYSSACPCSAELAEHARVKRGVFSIPHNQRSKARLRVEVRRGARLKIEDLQRHCLKALRTETQVMVKREDEQAFAELNGAHIKFVEDAARLLFEQLDKDKRLKDFQVACAHFESLHSHDAVSTICKGLPGGMQADFSDFRSLLC